MGDQSRLMCDSTFVGVYLGERIWTFSLFCTFCFSMFCCVDFFVSFVLRHSRVSHVLLAWENSRHFATPSLVSPWNDVWELKRAQKFHTVDASLPRTGWCFWLVVARGKISSTNQKHFPDLGSDASSVWKFCTRFSDVISQGNQWWRRKNVGCFLRQRFSHWRWAVSCERS